MKRANYHFASKSWKHTHSPVPSWQIWGVYVWAPQHVPWEASPESRLLTGNQGNKEHKILFLCTVHHGSRFRLRFLCIFSLPLFTSWLSIRAVVFTLLLKSIFSVLLWLSGSLQRQWKFHNTEEKLGIWLWRPSGCWNKPSAPRRSRILKTFIKFLPKYSRSQARELQDYW